ncbi:hypothetical protein KUV85_09525 [Nocardioides panacisoli]|uniref:hypothetical protein n=1 Tax=Nocardioides panacisoli TaxID=627624 RepID=UPI001C636C14|nr:hypothetical protein [Nocardioides panacisoli]QYJ02579.1 hypothetical protein KUV85_09525 [Nocardioides panacisoli]
MSDHDPWESAMSRDFDARVRDLHEAPLDLRDVRDTARSIRRRRRATAAGGVLAAAAIVVPVALLAGLPGTEDRSGPGPAEDPTTPGETAVVEPAEPTYLAEGTWHRADGSTVDVPDEGYNEAVIWDNRLVALRWDGDNSIADVITEDGTVVESFAVQTGSIAVNEEGTTLAWTDGDGEIMVRWEDGRRTVGVERGRAVGSPVIAVTGDCSAGPTECTIYTKHAAYTAGPGTVEPPLGGRPTYNDARAGLLTLTEEVSDDSSCGSIFDITGDDRRVRGCEHTFAGIAPGGEYVLGLPSYLDGIGPGRAAILDAATGTELARYDDTTVMRTAWVDESRLLIDAYDYDDRVWRLLTLAPDGSVTQVAGPVPGEDMDNPFTVVRR